MRRAAALIAPAALAVSGCGEDAPREPLGEALATVSQGHPGATGAGFLDVGRLLAADRSRREIADVYALALGPGGDDAFEEAGDVRRTLGLDPFAADRAVSLAGSYTFGIRLDGAPTNAIERRLRQGPRPADPPAGWTLHDLGPERSVPARLASRGLGPRGARVAIGAERVVFASFDSARSRLIGQEGSLLDDARTDLAVDCLGDAVAARIVPARLILSRDIGADLVAVGMPLEGPERACFVGDEDSPLLQGKRPLEDAFRLERIDPVSRRPIGHSLAAAEVELLEGDDGAVAGRVELTPAPGTGRGYALRSLNTGALVSYLGHEGLFEARDP